MARVAAAAVTSMNKPLPQPLPQRGGEPDGNKGWGQFITINEPSKRTTMTPENKKQLFSFLWKLVTALVTAIGTAMGVSCAANALA